MSRRLVLILLSDTGGGHRASAKGLQDAFYLVYGESNINVKILDIWTEYGSWPFNSFVPIYRFASGNPLCWKILYASSQSPISRSIFLQSGYTVAGQGFVKVFLEYKPDLIISVHPLCQHVPLRILKELQMTIPFATVVTDLGGAHPTWYHPSVDRLYVPSENLRQAALKEGVEKNKLRRFGLPLRSSFWANHNTKLFWRKKLNLFLQIPTVVIIGGGEGIGGIHKITSSIIQAALADENEINQMCQKYLPNINLHNSNHIQLQIVIICGKNQQTRLNVVTEIQRLARTHPLGHAITLDHRHLDDQKSGQKSSQKSGQKSSQKSGQKSSPPSKVHCVACGFATNMDEWMSASDLVVTKAGPGTIAEAATRGLPVLLSSHLPGQEEGNVNYVLENGFGTYCEDAGMVGVITRQWLTNPLYNSKFQHMRDRSLQSSNPTAAVDIAIDLGSLIGLEKKVSVD